MAIDNFIKRLEQENQAAPGSHIVEPGLLDEELKSWTAKNPNASLPKDYLALLKRCNGVRVYPDGDTPTGSVRLLPLREVVHAPRLMYLSNTSVDDDIPDTWYALTDDPDSAQFLILDVATGKYLEVDPMEPSDPMEVGDSMEDVLQWLDQFFK